MRRRRQGLQVSTFPFLAVLLCAMGSLILLLLVIDRRAKMVARARALQGAQQRPVDSARTAVEDAARRAELERRRQALHQLLVRQDQDLLVRVRTVQQQSDEATRDLERENTRGRQLGSQLEAESSRLEQEQAEVQAHHRHLSQDDAHATASQGELVQMSQEVLALEHTLADLKALRQRDQQTYSLVPYKGHSGDSRKPLYVECTSGGVVFHPDRLALEGLQFSPAHARAEVEQRIARQQAALRAAGGASEHPYLLMLVRPDGIASYYQTLKALDGIEIDFGYEFIERDWVLDFPRYDNTARTQPWMIASKTAPPVAPSQNQETASSRFGTRRLRGLTHGDAQSACGLPLQEHAPSSLAGGAFPSGKQEPGQAETAGRGSAEPAGLRSHDDTAPSLPGSESTVEPEGSRFSSFRHRGSLGGSGTSSGLAQAPGGDDPLATPGGFDHGNGSAGGLLGPPLHTSVLFGQRTGQGGSSQLASPDSPSVQAPENALTGAGQAASAQSLVSGGTSSKLSATPPGQGEAAATTEGQLPGRSSPGAHGGGHAGEAQGDNASGTLPGDAAATTEGHLPGRSSPGAHDGARAGEAEAGSGQGSSNESTSSLLAGGHASKPSLVRPGRLLGNRDWVIGIECTADALVVYPTRLRFATDSLPLANPDNPLFQAVSQAITRHQATVYPGEPPYRPIIRFLVRPDGQRSYYVAYPCLEPLHVPMKRENLEENESIDATRLRP